MSTANMKLVVLDVPLEGDMESPDQKLEDGEAIVRRAIELRSLNKELKGMCSVVQPQFSSHRRVFFAL
jgi:ADP-ribose pyrophosphatase